MPEDDERESRYAEQSAIFGSDNIKLLYIAAQGRNQAKYGELGSNATKSYFVQALGEQDPIVDRLIGQTAGDSLRQSVAAGLQAGQDPYSVGASFTPPQLLDNATRYFESTLEHLKVGDFALEGVQYEDTGAYIGDLGEEQRNQIVSTYLADLADGGVAQAILQNNARRRSRLNDILNPPQEGDEDNE